MIEVVVTNDTSFPCAEAALEGVVARTFLVHNVTEAVVGVHIVDEPTMKQLNEQYKHHQGATDVLTFVLHDPEQPTPSFLETDETAREYGDVFLCYPVIAADASTKQIAPQEHVEFLLEHGCLHLLGVHHE